MLEFAFQGGRDPRLLQAAACLCVIFLVFALHLPQLIGREPASGFSLSSLLMLSPSSPFARYEWTTSRNIVQCHQNQGFHLCQYVSAILVHCSLRMTMMKTVRWWWLFRCFFFAICCWGWGRKLKCGWMVGTEWAGIELHDIFWLENQQGTQNLVSLSLRNRDGANSFIQNWLKQDNILRRFLHWCFLLVCTTLILYLQ